MLSIWFLCDNCRVPRNLSWSISIPYTKEVSSRSFISKSFYRILLVAFIMPISFVASKISTTYKINKFILLRCNLWYTRLSTRFTSKPNERITWWNCSIVDRMLAYTHVWIFLFYKPYSLDLLKQSFCSHHIDYLIIVTIGECCP